MRYTPFIVTGHIMNIPLLEDETENNQEASLLHPNGHAQMILAASRLFWVIGLSYLLFKGIVLTVRRKLLPYELEQLYGKLNTSIVPSNIAFHSHFSPDPKETGLKNESRHFSQPSFEVNDSWYLCY